MKCPDCFVEVDGNSCWVCGWQQFNQKAKPEKKPCPQCRGGMDRGPFAYSWRCGRCGHMEADQVWEEARVEAKECDTCGKMFIPKYEWSRDCTPCFMASPKGKAWAKRKAEEANGWDNAQQERYEQARRQRDKQAEQEREYARRQQGPYGNNNYEAPRRPSSTPTATLDATFLRKLLQLCHPDKHGGSELASNVTKELLEMKAKLR